MSRLSISLPHELMRELDQAVDPRKRSRFIQRAIDRSLRELRDERLAREYEEAAAEIHGANREMEGTLGDGLD